MTATATGDSDRGTRQVALYVLLGATVLVAFMTFALSFQGNDGYGQDVAKVGYLSVLVPLGIDGLTVVAIAATFLLRHAGWRQRAYAWLVFAVSCGASIAGNLSHADHMHLDVQGRIGAAAWPAMLALTSHLTIVTLRTLDRLAKAVPSTPRRAATRPAAPRPPRSGADVQAAIVRDAEDIVRAAERLPRARTEPADKPGKWDQAEARRRLAAGESCASVALVLGVSKKTIERYQRRRATSTREGTP